MQSKSNFLNETNGFPPRAWMHPNGDVDFCNWHVEWLVKNGYAYDYKTKNRTGVRGRLNFVDSYKKAFDDNWVRVVLPNRYNAFELELEASSMRNIANTANSWKKYLNKANFVLVIDNKKSPVDYYRFDMPQDKKKLFGLFQIKEAAEFKEDEYGAWIAPNGKIHYVGGRSGVGARHYVLAQKISNNYELDLMDMYEEMYRNGYIRVTVGVSGITLGLDGTYSSLKKAFSLWFSRLKNVEQLFIDIKKEDGTPTFGAYHKFILPQDRNKIRKLFTGLNESVKPIYRGWIESMIKENFDQKQYGAWIEPNGKLHYITGHIQFAEEMKEKYDTKNLKISGIQYLIYMGWLRISLNNDNFYIHGVQDALVKNFKNWFPSVVKEFDYVSVDLISDREMILVSRPGETWSISGSKGFSMPEERAKLKRFVLGTAVEEDMFSDKKPSKYLDAIFNKTNHDSMGARYEVSMMKHQVGMTEQDGQKLWNEDVMQVRSKSNLPFREATKVQMMYQAEANKFNKRNQENGWNDYFVRVNKQNNEIDESIDVDQYGGWIEPNGKIHYVENQEHKIFARNYIRKHKKLHDFEYDVYGGMYSIDWVRFTTSTTGTSLNLQGFEKSLKKQFKHWVKHLRNFEYLDIDFRDGDSVTYHLPVDMSKIRKKFINESEFLMPSRYIVELQPHWNDVENREVKWKVFVDGKNVGSVLQKSENKFHADKRDFNELEKAIAHLTKEAGFTTSPGISPSSETGLTKSFTTNTRHGFGFQM